MKKLCALVISLLLILFVSLPPSFAAEVSLVPAHTDIKNPKSFSNLIINGKPGDEKQGEFAAVNLTDSKISLKLKTLDAKVLENGEIAGSEDASPSGVGRWLVTTDKEIILLPKERKILGFTIKIPSDARGGEHVGAIFTNNASLPVWVKVEGVTTAEFFLGELTNEFKNDKPEFKISVKNRGNSVIDNLGFTLNLTNFLGIGADRSLRNFWGEEIPILPGQEKEFTFLWENPLPGMIGKYSADLEVSTAGKMKMTNLSFTYIGWNAVRSFFTNLFIILIFIVSVFVVMKKLLPGFSPAIIRSFLARLKKPKSSQTQPTNLITSQIPVATSSQFDISQEVRKITEEEKNIAGFDESGYDKIWFKVRKIVREEIELWKEMDNFRKDMRAQIREELLKEKKGKKNKS